MSDNAKVAKAATQKSTIELGELALIGTFGTEQRRSALVRHSSGRIVKVTMGERVSGRKVVAIDKGILYLQTSGGTRKLEMPAS